MDPHAGLLQKHVGVLWLHPARSKLKPPLQLFHSSDSVSSTHLVPAQCADCKLPMCEIHKAVHIFFFQMMVPLCRAVDSVKTSLRLAAVYLTGGGGGLNGGGRSILRGECESSQTRTCIDSLLESALHPENGRLL